MRELRTGERVDIAGPTLALKVAARHDPVLRSRTGIAIVPLGVDDRLIDEFNLLLARNRELRPGASFNGPHGVAFELNALPAAVMRLLVVVYTIGGPRAGNSLADLGDVSVHLDGDMTYRVDMTERRDAAMILVEVYRRNDRWRISTNGQGFMGGIAMMSQALGIDIAIPDAGGDADRGDRDHDNDHPPVPGSSAGGSGFAVGPRLVVTNFHVIEDAVRIAVSCETSHGAARVMASDPVHDIALLSIDHDAAAVARFRSGGDIDLGEDIIVAGFPLQGLLGSGPQISGGNVSALTGMRNDSGQLQFNAPIGSGSSGGPILDSSGLVVGLVRAVLRTDLPNAPIAQNMNFGVKATLVRSFLHAFGVIPVQASSVSARNRADIAREARTYLYKISVDY